MIRPKCPIHGLRSEKVGISSTNLVDFDRQIQSADKERKAERYAFSALSRLVCRYRLAESNEQLAHAHLTPEWYEQHAFRHQFKKHASLFADAEPGKNLAQQVVAGQRSGDFPHGIQR
ncbi:MAG: hypothetical protein ACKO26_21405, partial [Planctomycetota bacterium]